VEAAAFVPQPATRIEEITAVAIAASTAMPQLEPDSAVPAEVSALEAADRAASLPEIQGLDSEGLRSAAHDEAPAPEMPRPPAEAQWVTASPAAPRGSAIGRETSRVPLHFELPTDLEQIESNPEKVRAAEQYEATDDEPRAKRARPAPKPVSDEPLVQVETAQTGAPGAGTPSTRQPG
jgi:hypothetical protein